MVSFIIIVIIAFILGIICGLPFAKFVCPPTATTIIILLSPWLFLYFFSENPIVNTLRYLYLSWAIGVLASCTYYEIKKKTIVINPKIKR